MMPKNVKRAPQERVTVTNEKALFLPPGKAEEVFRSYFCRRYALGDDDIKDIFVDIETDSTGGFHGVTIKYRKIKEEEPPL